MSSLFDQAQAIWNALDTMRDNDPEGYKKFINEQLEDGKGKFGKKNEESKSNPSFVKTKTIDETLGLNNLNLNNGTSATVKKQNPASKPKSNLQNAKKSQSTNQLGSNSLMDEEIGADKSIISKIVTTLGDVDDEEDTILKLIIPTVDGARKKGKSLIEEL